MCKDVPLSGHNETVRIMLLVDNRICHLTWILPAKTHLFSSMMSKLQHESGLLLLCRGSYTNNAICVAFTCFVKLHYRQYFQPVPLQFISSICRIDGRYSLIHMTEELIFNTWLNFFFFFYPHPLMSTGVNPMTHSGGEILLIYIH